MSSLRLAALLLLLSCFVLPQAPGEDAAAQGSLPLPVRKYLVGKYFQGRELNDPAIDVSVEILKPAAPIIEQISALEWEKGQLDNFASNKLFLVVRCPDRSVRAIHFRDGACRNDRLIDESRLRVLNRLYSAGSFNDPPAPELARWLAKDSVSASDAFLTAIARVNERRGAKLDLETIERASRNLAAPGTNADAIARALNALAESTYAVECCWAGIWLLSRMDKMSFMREEKVGSVEDLAAADARTFYENVYYAVKARMEFPWARKVTDRDFLEFVLSPRATNEPLQRWRRHFFEALQPETKGLGEMDFAKARAIAENAYGDYFQYDGNTTWEDFGLLTSLAVHEGRCEDCSNVLNAMYWTLGIPACQAFTPWWGHVDGNHAWTWVRGMGDPPGDGNAGVKIYVKTWDSYEDVTKEYSPVTRIAFSTESKSAEPVTLMVWNSDDWRVVARAKIMDGQVAFENVGCRLPFALCIRVPGEPDRIADVRQGGNVKWLRTAPDDPADGAQFEMTYGKDDLMGGFNVEEEYTLFLYADKGWKEIPLTHPGEGKISFAARADRLYRLSGKKSSPRPFTVEPLPSGRGHFTIMR
ncbi:MAG: transglutaminase domain-containing protein [Candidatus Brocadiia bacterium]